MPALEALLHDFEAAHTQPLGLSVDSVHSHANWAKSLGGVSFPLLADFHPKGEVASAYGMYLAEAGITDRASVIVDCDGNVRHASTVGPGGKRDMKELLGICQALDAQSSGDLGEAAVAGLPGDAKLFVKSSCGFSRSVLTACENLHLTGSVPVVNVSDDPSALAELETLTASQQAPCLVIDGKPMLESADIIQELVTRKTGLW